MRTMHGRTHLERLTPRECDVLGCLFDGLSNRQIAARLGMSPMTVKTHMQVIYEVFGLENHAGFRGLTAGLLKRGWLVWNLPERQKS
jgi:DNA-binding NarL/FixJ family response regulator